jgi:hypothetical protein
MINFLKFLFFSIRLANEKKVSFSIERISFFTIGIYRNSHFIGGSEDPSIIKASFKAFTEAFERHLLVKGEVKKFASAFHFNKKKSIKKAYLEAAERLSLIFINEKKIDLICEEVRIHENREIKLRVFKISIHPYVILTETSMMTPEGERYYFGSAADFCLNEAICRSKHEAISLTFSRVNGPDLLYKKSFLGTISGEFFSPPSLGFEDIVSTKSGLSYFRPSPSLEDSIKERLLIMRKKFGDSYLHLNQFGEDFLFSEGEMR